MTKSLQSLNELHNTSNFAFNAELEAAFGAAVKTMGPRVVLKAVPLKLDVVSDPPDFPQSWLLPVLQDYVQCTEIAYYVEELLPIAGKMRELSQTWKKNGKELEAKLFDTLEYQIWCLLSSFCKKPTDISASFQSIAKILGTALTEKTEIRNMVCLSLKSLIEGSKGNGTDQAEVGRFSKNYLPILFNLYTNDPLEGEPPREPILECIAVFLSITEQKLLQSFFSKVLTKLKDPAVQSYARMALEDIAEVFVPYLHLSSLVELFQLVSPILDSGNTTSQKKAYKLLAAILSCTSPEHTSFISEHLSELQSVLLSSLSTAGVGTKKPRLRCLINIVPHLTSDNTDFVLAVIPEAIMCTKESNEKCRSLSYQLLSSLGWSSQRLYLKSPEDSMREYFNIVIAGLAGSSHMVSATIGVLARLVYEFHDLLGSQLIETLLNSVSVFLSAKVKEVVRSTLIFIKVAIGILPQTELAPHVKDLIESILTWNENNKNHFRLKARVILERLIRKFSFEMIASFVPTKHRRLIIHIRKTNDRHKRKKREKWEEMIAKNDDEDFVITKKPTSKPSFEELIYDSDDDDDETDKRKQFSVKGKKETQKARGRTWLKEGENDEPLNFLDPSATQRVLGTDPSNLKKKQKSSDGFIFSNDGRLIINDDIQLEKTEEKKDLAILETGNLDRTDVKCQKRKRGRNEDSDQDDDKFPLSAGAAGGSGIHRKDPVKMKFKDYGADYRAKKARGDIKKPGKPDPYAYIQLDRQKLNRRKRAKLSGQFQGILHKANKGAALGRKQRGKRLKKRTHSL